MTLEIPKVVLKKMRRFFMLLLTLFLIRMFLYKQKCIDFYCHIIIICSHRWVLLKRILETAPE